MSWSWHFRDSEQDRGSAAADFILVSVPMVLISVSTITICFSAFTQILVKDAAIEAARFAALADQDISLGCARARQQIESVLGSIYSKFTCRTFGEINVPEKVVEVTLPFRLMGIIDTTIILRGIGRAPIESQ